jgi:hypothetical protein
MSAVLAVLSPAAKAAVAALFRDAPPVIVEVRFPGAGTAPDWHLLDDEEAFESLIESLAPGVELRLNSVWDLRSSGNPLCVGK